MIGVSNSTATTKLGVLVTAIAALVTACSDPCATPENEEILRLAAAEEGAIRTESGLVFRELEAGSGPAPEARNRVQVHYEGRLSDGTVFERPRTATFKLSDVIPGWTEGLQLLKGGGKAKLTIPAKLAYGKKGKRGAIPPCATLIFEIALLGIYD